MLFWYKSDNVELDQHSCVANVAGALQCQQPMFDPDFCRCLCVVCMFPLCEFPPGTLVSSYIPKTSRSIDLLATVKCCSCVGECQYLKGLDGIVGIL